MDHTVLLAFFLTLLAGLSTGIGSCIAFLSRHTNRKFLSVSLGFSAGVMIYVSMIEIFFIAGTFHITSFLLQAGLVALGELGVCIVLGLPLTALLERTRLADRLFKMQSNG